jgi:hypothetical protein
VEIPDSLQRRRAIHLRIGIRDQRHYQQFREIRRAVEARSRTGPAFVGKSDSEQRESTALFGSSSGTTPRCGASAP